jgi:anti-anti-sigma regulatory factor
MLSQLLHVQTHSDDSLTIRRGRSLAALLLLLIVLSVPFVLGDFAATGTITGTLINGIAILIFLSIYAINRSGRLQIAVTLFLSLFCILPIGTSLLIRSPLPQIFFPCIVIVIAAAFGPPRAPLIWAGIITAVPLVINLALYGTLLPPPGPVLLPGGVESLPILAFEMVAVILYWMLAVIAWISSRQLFATIAESQAATQVALAAQASLTAQQSDLAARNEELIVARRNLEALVQSLTVPVVPVADGVGLLPIVGTLDAERSAALERSSLATVSAKRMRALVVDLSGITLLDETGATALVRLCAALSLLGVTPILAGLGVRGAMLLSDTQVTLPRTVATVQDALSLLRQEQKVQQR